MTLEEVNEKYEYQSDLDKYGWNEVWTIPNPDSDGKFREDCEGYCAILKHNVPEFNDWDYCYCKIRGNGHCILYKDGMVIDCNARRVMAIDLYTSLYVMSDLKKYNWFVKPSKFAVGAILYYISICKTYLQGFIK